MDHFLVQVHGEYHARGIARDNEGGVRVLAVKPRSATRYCTSLDAGNLARYLAVSFKNSIRHVLVIGRPDNGQAEIRVDPLAHAVDG